MKRIDASDPQSIRYRFRKRRFQVIEGLIADLLASRDHVRILDVGGTRAYWKLLDPALAGRVHITVLNNAASELSTHRADDLAIAFEDVVGDGCAMPQYDRGQFDLVHSNSVIEHVGSYTNMARFAGEVRRVGQAYYVQTPYLWFPLEPHYGVPFVHWLPDAMRLSLHTRMRMGYARRCDFATAITRIDHVRIVNQRVMRELFPDGEMVRERFMLMTKSVSMIRRIGREAAGA